MCKSIISTLYVKVNISCPTLQLQPKTRNKTRGQPRLSVTYPKYKEGEATVREARVPASYGNYATIGTCTTTDTNNTDYQSTMSSGTSIIQSLILYYIWDQLFPFWFSRNLIIKESYPLDPRALNNIIMLKKSLFTCFRIRHWNLPGYDHNTKTGTEAVSRGIETAGTIANALNAWKGVKGGCHSKA